ncbi:hypothetical protein [Sphingobacterium sp.]|uniref:hypothetical protein n=1 Tax=Sphingobacterium sp. TaxID=341027 RepID=UPI00289A0A66|nr:hypothetical protein [Sphingobacterium sp.]
MESQEDSKTDNLASKPLTCGIIMPIATHPDYPVNHWKDVLSILEEAISETKFEICLVWEDKSSVLIHERIVNNIYNSDIVICDVSSKNPNVMFELGLRLAFDKPTIIIKDEKTGYSFDTGVIDHLGYPSSLRFLDIKEFKEKLKEKITSTYDASISDKKYSPFLKQFGTKIVPATIAENEVTEYKYILKQLEKLQIQVSNLNSRDRNSLNTLYHNSLPSEISDIVRSEINEYTHLKEINSLQDLEIIKKNLEEKSGVAISAKTIRVIAEELGVWNPFKRPILVSKLDLNSKSN